MESVECQWDRLEDAVQRVDAYGIPPTLIHGDFHPGNVIAGDDRNVIIDWTDACISNPLMDLAPQVAEYWALGLKDVDWLVKVWDPLSEMRRDDMHGAFALAALHRAITYIELSKAVAASTPAQTAWSRLAGKWLSFGLDALLSLP